MPDISAIKKESDSKNSDDNSSQTHKVDDVKSNKKRGDFWRGVGLGLLIVFVFVPIISFLLQIALPPNANLATDTRIFIERAFVFLPTAGVIILMIYFAFKRPKIALGILSTIGLLVTLLIILLVSIMFVGNGCGFPGC